MQELLAGLPALEELVDLLGRGQEAESDQEPVAQRIAELVTRTVVVDAEAPGGRSVEVRGIERSGDLSRMLPTEAAYLAHPILRGLWRARWVEQSLLTYHAPGVLTNRVQALRTFEDGEGETYDRAHRGPVLIIFDTSGSMTGRPELTAKAAVFQIASVAFMERRPCLLYNFSGPGEVLEQELSFDGEGCKNLLAFMLRSFGGGTDFDAPLEMALARAQERVWKQADLVVVSDGYFDITRPALHGRLEEARRTTAMRLHGINVSAGPGFAALACDTVIDLRALSLQAGQQAARYVSPYG